MVIFYLYRNFKILNISGKNLTKILPVKVFAAFAAQGHIWPVDKFIKKYLHFQKYDLFIFP